MSFALRAACMGLVLLALAASSPGQGTPPPTTAPTVGLPGEWKEVVLPGPELEVATGDPHGPLVLRITRKSPHGSAFRYDFEYVGLEAGSYDLRDRLRHVDGTPMVTTPGAADAVPPLPVVVTSVLPPGIVKPHAPLAAPPPRLGGYRTAWIVGGVIWLAGLGVILFGWRRRRIQHAAANWKPRTLAERLHPLVENALAGKLSREQRAQLELGLVAYWRRKLALDRENPAEMLAHLRRHPEAGPLLTSMEGWLHMPVPPADVDVKALLAPYRNLPPDAIPELEPAVAGRALYKTHPNPGGR